MPEMNSVFTPTLQTADAQKLTDFYLKIGFKFEFGLNTPDGALVASMLKTPCERGNLMIEATQNFKRTEGDNLYLYSNLPAEADVDEVYQGFKAAGLEIVEEIKTQWWGDRNFSFLDPDGRKWTISKTVKEFNPADVPEGMTMKMPAAV